VKTLARPFAVLGSAATQNVGAAGPGGVVKVAAARLRGCVRNHRYGICSTTPVGYMRTCDGRVIRDLCAHVRTWRPVLRRRRLRLYELQGV
jgi:hypothetical protein